MADGRSPERLIALSDGIFAIAMTLLVLDLRVPPGLSPEAFRDEVGQWLPDLGAYALSFAILGGFWRDQRRILRWAEEVDGLVLRVALAGLGAIALVPFPTTMLSEYASQPLAVALYAATVVLVDLLQLALLLTIRRRVPGAGPGIAADLLATVVVFGVSVSIAYAVSPTAAIWSWLVLVPAKAVIGRREARRRGEPPGRRPTGV